MLQTACPTCGANVRFASSASVLAVCSHCHSTLARDEDSVRQIGKMADLLEDYSPLQLGTSGLYKKRAFRLIGRIQLRYSEGVWNEWYILFDDGATGWLAESVGQYIVTELRPNNAARQAFIAPPFKDIEPGRSISCDGKNYICCDVRSAHCVSGEGELPFVVGDGWQTELVDARIGNWFLTLDYSEAPAPPTVYVGSSVTLASLRLQNLRREEDVVAKAGKVKGETTHLECPNCGAPLDYQAGTATHLVCPYCASDIEMLGAKALVVTQRHVDQKLSAYTLKLGSEAKIQGKNWRLIGLLAWRETEDFNSTWIEYLLYNPRLGFRWLVEAEGFWHLGSLTDTWVDSASTGGQVVFHGTTYKRVHREYTARIECAAGAFPWRAKLGDEVQISTFVSPDRLFELDLERNAQEYVWSLSQRYTDGQVRQWFGLPGATPLGDNAPVKIGDDGLGRGFLYAFILLCFNLPLALAGQETFWGLMVCVGALWLMFSDFE